MFSTAPMSRLVSVANAAKLVRAVPKRTFTASSGNSAKFSNYFSSNSNIRNSSISWNHGGALSRYNFSQFAQSHQSHPSRFFSSSNSPKSAFGGSPFVKAASTNTSPFAQGQAVRNFSRRAWRAEQDAAHEAGRVYWKGLHDRIQSDVGRHSEDYWMRCGGFRGYHHHHHRHMRRRGPKRFLWRMMVLSTVFVAAPAVAFCDAPYKTLVLVPLTVFGVGAALMLTGKLMFVVLPVVAAGGAIAFWVTVMPSASTANDLKKILKRQERSGQFETATNILGPNWEIQTAKSNEWFRWAFPEQGDKKQLDKVDIRMTVFNPNDHSDRKERSLELLDRFKLDRMDEIKSKCKKHPDYDIPNSLKIKRDGDQFLIQLEEDGEKLMGQTMAKKYLALGRVVDKAAKEMEAAQPGLKLGDQVVLVHKNNRDSFWSCWSPYGDLSLRIPFNRTWVNDLSEL
ncbi:hypothetical protein BGZ76_009850 [Entomortierella beljakovae]|nr:hypothetical protein BGZ76_009850 [Entomortierella beljakovae]